MRMHTLLTCATLGLIAGAAQAQISSQQVTRVPATQQQPPLQLLGGDVAEMALSATTEPPMIRTDTPATDQGWSVAPIFTVGETLGSYLPVGILDGIGAFPRNGRKATVFVNHELNPGNGYAYTLQNGTMLTGARVSRFVIKRTDDGTITINQAGLAYRRVYDRHGDIVTDPAQINETGNAIDGLARFCSSTDVQGGTFGFVDDIYITGEETSKPFHPHGGTEWVLDVDRRNLWAAPALGRGGWENVTPIATGNENTVGLLLGDDVESAPLYLYVGQKDAIGDDSFLDRNGLAVGDMYAWRALDGSLTPADFNGENTVKEGTWVKIKIQDVNRAGQKGYDDQGYLDGDTQRALTDQLGCFSFSRPEDLATNPADGTQAVFASTGRGGLFPDDNWGTVYVVDVDFDDLSGRLTIIHDADGLAIPDEGIRSPDNLDWADNGKIYIQEDRSTSPSSLFGGVTGIEASIWELDPISRVFTRIAEVDRSVVVPAGTTDSGAGDLGNWETSGILDVTDLFETLPNERLLIATVQAHGIRDGAIGDNPLLDEGGQLVFLSKITRDDGND